MTVFLIKTGWIGSRVRRCKTMACGGEDKR